MGEATGSVYSTKARLLGIYYLDGLNAKLNATACGASEHIDVCRSLAREGYGSSLVAYVVGAAVRVAGHDDLGNVALAIERNLVVLVHTEAIGGCVVLRTIGLAVGIEQDGGAVAELYLLYGLLVLVAEGGEVYLDALARCGSARQGDGGAVDGDPG